jgi:magnesium-transporting ATPase (P-type)
MIASTQTPIFTAIEFHNDDDITSTVTEPLLLHDDVSFGNEENEKYSRPQMNFSCWWFTLVGVLVGFVIQVISLGAYSFMLVQYGTSDTVPTSDKVSEGDWFIYSILSFLTQVDLVIYVMIWVAFTCTMTRNGMAFIRFQYQLPIKRRSVFVLGVYFLVGIVLGAFVAWTLIDLYLGFPIPFGPIAATVVVDLFLCYLMVWCYDVGRDDEAKIEDEEDDEPTCC